MPITMTGFDGLLEAGNEAERAGRHGEARALYERALYAVSTEEEGLAASNVARRIAHTYLAEGDAEAGIGSARVALSIAEAHGSEDHAARALNLLGALLQTQGELDRALEAYRTAEERAARIDDARLHAMVQMNLATVSNIRGEFDTALSRYERSLAGFREAGAEEYVANVLNNMGMLYTDLGRWEEAEGAFELALGAARRIGSVTADVMVQVNLAELMVESGRLDEAERLCASCWELMAGIDHTRTLGELCKVHGVVLRERGEIRSADMCLQRAARLADERGDLLLRAEVLREQAVLFALQDRNRESLTALNRSHQLFQQLHARRDLADLGGKIEALEQTFLRFVRRWGESIESADLYTQGHCMRVADYACALARAAGFDAQTLFWFRMGALLHDVGKIVIPPEVLNKGGGFTPEERKLMERHTDAGVDLLRGIDFPWNVLPMIRYHHERWSGGGYPTGITGTSIPVSARILAIADVFDALTTDRPYRRAYSMRQSMEIMAGSMRGHFDPDLLELWTRLVERGEIDLPPETPGAAAESQPASTGLTAILVGEHYSIAELNAVAARWSGAARVVVADARDGRVAMNTSRELAASTVVVAAVRGRTVDCLESVGRAKETFGQIPVVALVEREDSALELRMIQHGAQDCLVLQSTDGYVLERTARRAIARGQLQSELHVQSLRDDLTGLHNRRGFFALGLRRLKSLRRGLDEPMVLFVDLNGLKEINDWFGHSEGDRALMEVAAVLRSAFREVDVLGRIGGDEFAVLTIAGSAGSRERMIEQVEQAIAARDAELGRRYTLSVSIGAAPVDYDDEAGMAQALDSADRAMYVRKHARRAIQAVPA